MNVPGLIPCIKKQFNVDFWGVLEGREEDLLYGQLQKFEVEIFKTAHSSVRPKPPFWFRPNTPTETQSLAVTFGRY